MEVQLAHDKELHVEIKVRNNRLKRRREDMGWSAPQFAKEVGLAYTTYIKLESCKLDPIASNGDWREAARKVADFWGESPEFLFPDSLRDLVTNRIELTADVSDMKRLSMGASPDEIIDRLDRKRLTATATRLVEESLSDREALVVAARADDESLDDIAETLGVSRERVRQIEAKGLRNLRNYRRARILAPFVGGETHQRFLDIAHHEKEYAEEVWRQEVDGVRRRVRASREYRRELERKADEENRPWTRDAWDGKFPAYIGWVGNILINVAERHRSTQPASLDAAKLCFLSAIGEGSLEKFYPQLEESQPLSKSLLWILEEISMRQPAYTVGAKWLVRRIHNKHHRGWIPCPKEWATRAGRCWLAGSDEESVQDACRKGLEHIDKLHPWIGNRYPSPGA